MQLFFCPNHIFVTISWQLYSFDLYLQITFLSQNSGISYFQWIVEKMWWKSVNFIFWWQTGTEKFFVMEMWWYNLCHKVTILWWKSWNMFLKKYWHLTFISKCHDYVTKMWCQLIRNISQNCDGFVMEMCWVCTFFLVFRFEFSLLSCSTEWWMKKLSLKQKTDNLNAPNQSSKFYLKKWVPPPIRHRLAIY